MTNKNNSMKNFLRVTSAVILIFLVSACSNGGGKQDGSLAGKKAQLEKLKTEQQKINDQIAALEDEITKANPAEAEITPKLVTVAPLSLQNFKHYIELQAKIDAEDISYPTPRGGPGQVKKVYVKEGEYVKKGELLLKLDDAVLQQNLNQLQTQLDYAKNIYDRQKNLWDQGIGTEVQYITARNNVTQAEKQIATLKQQMDLTNVRAEVDGIADEVDIHEGETFSGGTIKIVNTRDLKVSANIPENYVARVHKGSPIEIVIPDLNNRVINSTVSLISQSIDPNYRSFTVEAKIKGNEGLKPNQLATIKILDYTAKNTIVVPVNTVQSDENGKFVYVMEKSGDKMLAKRKTVVPGESYGDMMEIKSGLSSGDQLITAGYQDLYEGQIVAVETKM